MSPTNKKAASPRQGEAASENAPVTYTTPRGRRATTSLWFALRTLSGAALSPDDIGLLREALAELHGMLK